MNENNPSTSPEHEPTPAAPAGLPTEPANAGPANTEPVNAPEQTGPSFWRRTGTRVAAGIVAVVVLLLVGFGGGWLVRGELHRPVGVTAPGQAWDHDRGGMPGGGAPGMRDHDGDGFSGQRQDGDDDESAPGQQSTPDLPTPDSTTESTPSS